MKNITVYERAVEIGNYVIEHDATVRQAASVFNISKSTVHLDLTKRLSEESHILYDEVQKVLTKNKNERHLRGGESTKRKYIK